MREIDFTVIKIDLGNMKMETDLSEEGKVQMLLKQV